MRKLVDVTDRRTRLTQMASVAVASAFLGLGAGMIGGPGSVWVPPVVLATGAALLALAATVRQRWEVDYKGHRVRFENSAVLAERLFLDEGLVARGGVGRMMEMRAPIRVGAGAGETIVALSEAGLTSVRLRLFVEGPEGEPEPSVPARAQLVESAPPAASSQVATDTAVLGTMAVAKQTVELVAAVIGIIGGVSALVGWLS